MSFAIKYWFFCRRLYHCMAYLLIFQNTFVGLFSATRRVILSAAFSFVLISRLDKVLFMKGFESFDEGEMGECSYNVNIILISYQCCLHNLCGNVCMYQGWGWLQTHDYDYDYDYGLIIKSWLWLWLHVEMHDYDYDYDYFLMIMLMIMNFNEWSEWTKLHSRYNE